MITKVISLLAVVAGCLVIAGTGTSFIGENQLALSVTVSIAIVFLVGVLEMVRYQKATGNLSQKLAMTQSTPDDLERWLQGLDSTLIESVRSRVCGESAGLPNPVLTPYLTGLLVMLGLLGTFVGMVDMLQGAVTALEGTTELEAVREGLTAPISGLGLAFGTSVSGVAASAALGLVSALGRRERALVSRQLDNVTAKWFRSYSLAQRRDETYDALQVQAQFIPDITSRLTDLTEIIEKNAHQMGQQLLDNQKAFQQLLQDQLSAIADSNGAALEKGLLQNASAASTIIAESVDRHMEGISTEVAMLTSNLSQKWASALEQERQSQAQLLESLRSSTEQQQKILNEGSINLLDSFSQAVSDQSEIHQSALARATESIAREAGTLSEKLFSSQEAALDKVDSVLNKTESLVVERLNSETKWQEEQQARATEIMTLASDHLTDIEAKAQQRFQAVTEQAAQQSDKAVEQLQGLEAAVARHLSSLGESLEAPITRMVDTASTVPQAAAGLMSELRDQLDRSSERENELVSERVQTLAELSKLQQNLSENSQKQHQLLNSMLASSGELLEAGISNLDEHAKSEQKVLVDLGEQVAANTAELSVLANTFSDAITHFGEANNQLVGNLLKIDEALQASAQRGDEQMNYYVAQAREIIDHMVLSHQQWLDQIRDLNSKEEVGA